MRLWSAILVGLQVMSAGSVLADMADPKWAATFALLVASAQAGTAYYMKSGSSDQQERPVLKSEPRSSISPYPPMGGNE